VSSPTSNSSDNTSPRRRIAGRPSSLQIAASPARQTIGKIRRPSSSSASAIALFSLASDPHHYAHGFAVEPSGEGPPAMWELVRGEMDRAHEITRVRWEIREGRAAPSSAWEGADACMPAVRDAVFIPSGTQVELTVFGSGFCPRAVPLIAWVGDQAVSRIVLGSDGGRFSGMLVDPPNDGDRVRVGWADGELHDTEIVFRSKVTDP
jgi:hypothetical protein